MREIIEQAPASISSVKQSINYAIPLRWVLSHVLLLSFVFIEFVWKRTLSNDPFYLFLRGMPLIILAAFAAQVIGIVRVFQKPSQYLLWVVALVADLIILLIAAFHRDAKAFQVPWGFALVGGLVGLIEALVLRTSYKRAWWWIPANAAGLMLGMVATIQLSAPVRSLCRFASSTNPQCDYSNFIFPVVMGVSIFSIFTGATLAWIARREATTSATTPAPLSRRDFKGAMGAAGAFALVLLGSVLLTQFSFLPQQAIEQALKHKAGTFLSDIDMVSPQEGWAVGGTNTDTRVPVTYHYTDGNWIEVDLPTSPYFSNLDSVSMTSANEGWAVGDESTFLHYANGTWTRARPPAGMATGAQIHSVEMLNPSDGWALTYDSRSPMLHYNGEKWDYVQLNINDEPFLRQMSFSTPDDGWAIGSTYTNAGVGGITLHYTGGEWRNVENQMTVDPEKLQVLSSDDVWAVSAGHTKGTTIFHYTNGKWSTSGFFPDLDLGTFVMISPNEGWAIGIVDKDGPATTAMARYDGTRWTRAPEGTPIPPISRVSMISPTEGWAVGGSSFYHYQNGAWTPYTQP